jgi:hypothetical protein
MNSPGVYDLGTLAITTAVTGEVITEGSSASGASIAYVDRLEGMLAATIEANFTYGSSGGTTAKVTVETTLNQGTTWIEVARFAFTTASKQSVVNLSGLTAVTTVYTPAALSDDSVKDGILGDRFRAKVTTTGTYVGNASVTVRLQAR